MMKVTIDNKDCPPLFEEETEKPEIWWVETVRMFCTNKPAIVGLSGLFIIVLVGLFGPMLFKADPFAIMQKPFTRPGDFSTLGTDYLGRDVFNCLIYGTRPTLAIAIIATAVTVLIGISIGAIAGFYGGTLDNLLMRITEFFQVLPPLVFAMVIVAVFTPTFVTVVFAIGVTTWTSLARLTRAEFLKIKEREFVMAARAVGANKYRLIIRVLLPNALPPLIVAITLRIGMTIITEAALSFLG